MGIEIDGIMSLNAVVNNKILDLVWFIKILITSLMVFD
jgi:hypothetical protein